MKSGVVSKRYEGVIRKNEEDGGSLKGFQPVQYCTPHSTTPI